MEEEEYKKVLLEQYKMMVNSSEKVTDIRQRANVFFLTIISSLISVSFLFGKEFYFNRTALLGMFVISILCFTISLFWYFTIISYRKLNKGKFALIFELETKLKSSLFEREWKILKSPEVKYKETSQIEKNIVILFIAISSLLALSEIFIFFDKGAFLLP